MAHTREHHRVVVAAFIALAACEPPPPFQLTTSVGGYSDGSGLVSLAALLTVRDFRGRGPEVAQGSITKDGEVLARFDYAEPGSGSVAAFYWPSIQVSEGSSFAINLTADGHPLAGSLAITDGTYLEAPHVAAASDGQALKWQPVSGAATYSCEVLSAGALQHRATGSTPECDVSALPAGTYAARVLALSADVEALRSDTSQHPALPPRFDMSEGRFAFVRGDGGELLLTASTSGGQLSYGGASGALAILLSLADGAGAPPSEAFFVEVVGPGLPVSSPLQFLYPAGAARHLVWSYDTPATEGRYSLTATSATSSVATTVSVGGVPSGLQLPVNVSAAEFGAGGADVAWDAVAGASSYYVGVWERQTGNFATGQWVGSPAAQFPVGTLAASTAYDVYVAATNVDMMSAAAAPAQLLVSENTYSPAGFTTR